VSRIDVILDESDNDHGMEHVFNLGIIDDRLDSIYVHDDDG
jgi:hypothetical protein